MQGDDLPRRTRAHAVADEGTRWVTDCLPSSWITEQPRPDYGIDLHVEVVDQGRPTGMCIDVQVKATDSPFPRDGISTYRAAVRSVNYWLRRPAPVLLVRYFAGERQGQYLWVKEHVTDVLAPRNSGWQRQSTVTLRFQDGFGAETAAAIVTHLYRTERRGILEQHRLVLSIVGSASPPHDGLSSLGELPVGLFPACQRDAIDRVNQIVERLESGDYITTEEGEFAWTHLPELGFWAAVQKAHQARCYSHLKQLGMAAVMAAQDAGRFPCALTWTDELRPYLDDRRADELMSCPLVGTGGYAMNAGLSGEPVPSQEPAPLLYDAEAGAPDGTAPRACARHLGHGHVLMSDGSVRLGTVDDVECLLK